MNHATLVQFPMNDAMSPAAPRRLAVLGGTGAVGRQLVSRARAAGHAVRVLVRDAARARALPALAGAQLVEGDARSAADVLRAVTDCDAVLVALGAPARDRSGLRTAAAAATVRAMRQAGVDRLVMLSVLGAGETAQALDWFTRQIVFRFWLQPTIDDHTAADAIVRDSGLAWTLLRPPHFTDAPATGRVHLGFDLGARPPAMSVPRGDVAAALLDCALRPERAGQELGIAGA